ncbi:MAG: hypothetical protein IJO07_03050, partial [Peptococcaceae bacterium]|nr:hypothetical protein [Peptococcaceae bacterium]
MVPGRDVTKADVIKNMHRQRICKQTERTKKGEITMRIAVPVEENEKEICPSFGRTPLFYIFDTETNSGTLIENDAMNAPGGAGIKAAQTVIDA